MLALLILAATAVRAADTQFLAEVKMTASANVITRRIWRQGDGLMRMETDGDQDWGGVRIDLTRGADVYTLDAQERIAWRTPTNAGDGRAHALIFDELRYPALEGLEYGREADFFRARGNLEKDWTGPARCDGINATADCELYRTKIDGLQLELMIGRDGLPHRLELDDHGMRRTVDYVRYAAQPLEPGRFAVPAAYRTLGGTRARTITGKGRGLDNDRFTFQESGGERIITDDMCRLRPTIFYIFSPSAGLASDAANLDVLFTRFGRGWACFIPLALSGPEYGPDPATADWIKTHRPRFPIYAGAGLAWLRPRQPPELPHLVYKNNRGFVPFSGLDASGFRAALNQIGEGVDDASASSLLAPDDAYRRLFAEPETIESQSAGMAVAALLARGDFPALDALARRLRDGKERFVNGVWKLNGFYSALTAGSLVNETERTKRVNLLNAWIKAYPGSVAPRVALGEIWLQYAFLGRGYGWADGLNRDQIRLLHDRLGLARSIFAEARNLGERDPELYVKILQLAKADGLPKDDAYALYRQGAACFPSYQYLHVEMANYLDPRWHGELGDGEAMLLKMAETNADGLGDEQYARAALLMHDDLRFAPYGERFFDVSDFSWPRVKKGFLDIEKRSPSSRKNLNFFAFFAAVAGDRATARDLFARIADDYYPSVWGNRVYYERWRGWARAQPPAYAGPFGAAMPVRNVAVPWPSPMGGARKGRESATEMLRRVRGIEHERLLRLRKAREALRPPPDVNRSK